MTLRAFFRLIEGCRDFAETPLVIRRRIGDDVFDALVAEGWLEETSPASTWPCPHEQSSGCRRAVERLTGKRRLSYVAECERPSPKCETLFLSAERTRQYGTTVRGTVDTLRRILGLRGDVMIEEGEVPMTYLIGAGAQGGLPYDVFACLSMDEAALRLFLKARSRLPRGTTMWVVTASRLPVDLETTYAPGSHVELFSAAEALECRKKTLRLRPVPPVRPGFTPAREEPKVGIVHDGNGTRPVTRVEYERLRAGASEFDLFLDGLQPDAAGRYFAHVRGLDGASRTAVLTANMAEVIRELVASPQPLRLADFKGLQKAQVLRPRKVIERARALIDVPCGRRKWRAFHRRDVERECAYVFRPPPGLRYCVLWAEG